MTRLHGIFPNESPPECILDFLTYVKLKCLKLYGLWYWPCLPCVYNFNPNMAFKIW